MQFLGPSPKVKNENDGLNALFSSLKRSGSNFSGSGKYSGSLCMPWKGICILVPTSRTICVPGTWYSLLHTRGVPGIGGCFLRVSVTT